jgi:hypothetical protein
MIYAADGSRAPAHKAACARSHQANNTDNNFRWGDACHACMLISQVKRQTSAAQATHASTEVNVHIHNRTHNTHTTTHTTHGIGHGEAQGRSRRLLHVKPLSFYSYTHTSTIVVASKYGSAQDPVLVDVTSTTSTTTSTMWDVTDL